MNNNKKNITLFVIICLSMSIFVFFLFKHYTSEKTSRIITHNLIPYIHDAKTNIKVNEKSVPFSSQGVEYNINFWIFINDYNYRLNEDKIIIQKGNQIFNPQVLLEKNSNNIKIILHTQFFKNIDMDSNPDSETEEESNDENIEEFVVENIKLQKWVNINILLIDNNLDVFIDGKLVTSFVINGYTLINTGSLDICPNGGFNGYITKLRYTNKSLNTSNIFKIYKQGPN